VGFCQPIYASVEEKNIYRTAAIEMKKYVAMVALAMLVSCGKDDPQGKYSCGEEISLEADVMPIISLHCAINACHSNGVDPVLNTTAEVIAQAERILVRTVAATMPPGGQAPLTADEIQLISCWVEDGAKNN